MQRKAEKTAYLLPLVYFLPLMVVLFGALSSCQASKDTGSDSKVDERASQISITPSVLDLFSCKPADAAFVAAHRGTQGGSPYPENTLEGLKALAEKGVQFAEVDVARLKDGTMILWHDGVWDRGSTGKGPIAASTWADAEKLLTKDTLGNVTSFRPSKFMDVLAWAKDDIYLEIDFKSSVNTGQVISAIRDAGMIDQVILISYSVEQALELHTHAPEAALSVGISKPGDIKALEIRGIPKSVMTGWTGRGPQSNALEERMRLNQIPILAGSFFDLDDKLQKTGRFEEYLEFAKPADLVVTTYALDAQKVLGLSKNRKDEISACLKKTK
jgi:glycerophosphoryl diester phosphodiesterase